MKVKQSRNQANSKSKADSKTKRKASVKAYAVDERRSTRSMASALSADNALHEFKLHYGKK